MALAGMGRAHPIAERGRLRDAAPDASDRYAAQKDMRSFLEDEEGKGFVARDLFGLAPQAPAESAARQIVRGPSRLPGRQEFAAAGAQARPGEIVVALGGAQVDSGAAQQR